MKEDLKTLSIEQLKKKEKQSTTAVYTLVPILIIMALCGVYLTFKKGFNVFTILPISFIPLIIAISKSLKTIRAEILARG